MRNWKIINIFLKILLLGLLVHAAIYPELSQYQGKAMRYRLIAYPLGAFSVVILRQIIGLRKKYPHNIDALITLIIVLDMTGNALGFYGSIEWWDDLMHFINSGLISILIYRITRPFINNKLILFIVVIGLVSWLQITWEILEYATFITINSKEVATAYRDTIGDLALGQLGSLIAFLLFYSSKN